MIDKKKFKAGLTTIFRENCYVSKGQSFYLDGTEAVVVVNMQKSDFDDKYYLNFGVWLKRFGINPFPKENHCHIQARISSLFPDKKELIEQACRINVTDEKSFQTLLTFLRVEGLPFFRKCIIEKSLKELVCEGWFDNSLIMKLTKDALANV